MGTDSGTKQGNNTYNTANGNYSGNNSGGMYGLMGDGGFGNVPNTGTAMSGALNPNYGAYNWSAGWMPQSGQINQTQPSYSQQNGQNPQAMYSNSTPWIDSSSGEWGQFNNGYNAADYSAGNSNAWRGVVTGGMLDGTYADLARGTGRTGLEDTSISLTADGQPVQNVSDATGETVNNAGNVNNVSAAGNSGQTANYAGANGSGTGAHIPAQAYYGNANDNYRPYDTGNGFDITDSIFAPDYYYDQTVEDLSPYTLAGRDAMLRRAVGGSDEVNQAKNQLMQTMGGAYMQSPVQNSAQNFINNSQTTPGFLSQYNASIRPEQNDYNARASQVDLNRMPQVVAQQAQTDRLAEASQADLDRLAQAGADRIDWNRVGESQARAGSVNLNNLRQAEAAQADTAQFNDIAQARAAQARENAGQYNMNDVAQAWAAQAAINPWQQDNNDYLDAMVDRAQKQTLSAVNSAFSKNGRYGSGAHEAAAYDGAQNLATQMYGEQYNQDRNRSLEAWNDYNNALLQNAQLQNAVNLQNASQYNTAGLQNAQTEAQIALQNAQLQNTTNLQNMNEWNQAGLQNAQMANAANQYNANLATNASIQNAANYLAGAQTNAQLGTQASVANANNAANLAQYEAQLGTQASIANANNAANLAQTNAQLGTQASITNANNAAQLAQINAQLGTNASTQNAANWLSGASQNSQLGTQTALQNSQLAANLANYAAQRDLDAWNQYQNNLLTGYNTNMNAGLLSQNLLQNAYQNERNNQLQAAQMAPNLAAEDYNDIQNLLALGTADQDYRQQVRNSAIDAFNYDQTKTLNALKNYRDLISTNG